VRVGAWVNEGLKQRCAEVLSLRKTPRLRKGEVRKARSNEVKVPATTEARDMKTEKFLRASPKRCYVSKDHGACLFGRVWMWQQVNRRNCLSMGNITYLHLAVVTKPMRFRRYSPSSFVFTFFRYQSSLSISSKQRSHPHRRTGPALVGRQTCNVS
jgi:hypothetical protein